MMFRSEPTAVCIVGGFVVRCIVAGRLEFLTCVALISVYVICEGVPELVEVAKMGSAWSSRTVALFCTLQNCAISQ